MGGSIEYNLHACCVEAKLRWADDDKSYFREKEDQPRPANLTWSTNAQNKQV